MNRYDFQALANLRVKEARVLLDNECFEGAHYLVGYAVECALKACIAKQTQAFDFPPDRNTVNRIYSHDLETLIREAGLADRHRNEINSNARFELNWRIAKEWSEQRRYAPAISRDEAENLYNAITDSVNGVLLWLKTWW
jgi:hypothetical protein